MFIIQKAKKALQSAFFNFAKLIPAVLPGTSVHLFIVISTVLLTTYKHSAMCFAVG